MSTLRPAAGGDVALGREPGEALQRGGGTKAGRQSLARGRSGFVRGLTEEFLGEFCKTIVTGRRVAVCLEWIAELRLLCLGEAKHVRKQTSAQQTRPDGGRA